MVIISSLMIMYMFSGINKTLLVGVFTLIVIWLISKLLIYRKLPPGPIGVPIFGYLPFLTGKPHITLMKLGEKYGKVFSLNMGGALTVIINDCEVFKKTINNPLTYSRPKGFLKIIPGRGGLVSKNGKEWLEQRRFTFTAMKDLGMGRGVWETMIQDSTHEFVKELKKLKGEPTDFSAMLEYSQMNSILTLIFGKGMFKDKQDSNFKMFDRFANDVVPFLSSSSVLNNFPRFVLEILRKFKIAGFDKLFQILEDFDTIVKREIKSHMSKSQLEKNASFVDHYLQQFASEKHDDVDEETVVDDLGGNIGSLFLGSVDTTKASVHWLLLFVAAYPEVQKKIHKEIDECIGKDHLIYWDERNNLPYTLATINEMQRVASIASLFPPRINIESMEIGGYMVPKGTIIIANNYSMMRDPKYHENPDDFKPERFLNSSNKLSKLESFFPFSAGKRNCPGEHVAMMTIFLNFSTIMQKFNVVCPTGKTIRLEEAGEGAVRHAVSQELCFIER